MYARHLNCVGIQSVKGQFFYPNVGNGQRRFSQFGRITVTTVNLEIVIILQTIYMCIYSGALVRGSLDSVFTML